MKTILIFLFLFVSSSAQSQTNLFLQKGGKKVQLKTGATLGLITLDDTIQYNYGTKGWRVDSIYSNAFTINQPNTYEYKTVLMPQLKDEQKRGWIIDSVLSDKALALQTWEYRLKKPLTYAAKKIDYSDITQIQFKKSEQSQGCIGCMILPVFLIVAPIISWENKEFHPRVFIPLFSIGVGGAILSYSIISRRKVRSYNIPEWKLVTRL